MHSGGAKVDGVQGGMRRNLTNGVGDCTIGTGQQHSGTLVHSEGQYRKKISGE